MLKIETRPTPVADLIELARIVPFSFDLGQNNYYSSPYYKENLLIDLLIEEIALSFKLEKSHHWINPSASGWHRDNFDNCDFLVVAILGKTGTLFKCGEEEFQSDPWTLYQHPNLLHKSPVSAVNQSEQRILLRWTMRNGFIL